MLESIRRIATIPELPVEALTTVAVIGTFLLLLLQDRIHPALIYVLQLYLSF